MDTPGYDPVSATGQVAGGANIICFTTGRGSVFGGAMTGTQLIAIGLVLAGGLIWWLRPGAKPVPAQTVSATR